MIAKSYPSVIYGDGGNGKSIIALSLGIAVARGADIWLGFEVLQTNVLFMDFELDEAEQYRRAKRLVAAEGVAVSHGLRYMYAGGVRPKEAFAAALEECLEHDIGLVIIDSYGLATEGDSELSGDVLAFHRECMEPFRRNGISAFIVDHQARVQAGERYQSKRPYGSVYKTNAVRSVFQVEAVEHEQGELTLRFRHVKANFGPMLQPFGAQLKFAEDKIYLSPCEVEDADMAGEQTVSARQRVIRALRSLSKGTKHDIADMTGLASSTVKKELSKLKRDGLARDTGEKGFHGAEILELPEIGTGTGTPISGSTGTGEDEGEIEI